jgi:hypothetical protein
MSKDFLARGSSFLTGGVSVGGPLPSLAVTLEASVEELEVLCPAIWGERVGGPGDARGELVVVVLVDIT